MGAAVALTGVVGCATTAADETMEPGDTSGDDPDETDGTIGTESTDDGSDVTDGGDESTGESDSSDDGGYGDDDPDDDAVPLFLDVRLLEGGVPREPILLDLEIAIIPHPSDTAVVPAPVDDPASVFVVVEEQLLTVAFDDGVLSLVGDPIQLGVGSSWVRGLGDGDLIFQGSTGSPYEIFRRVDGSWASPSPFQPMAFADGVVADVDGDASLDLLVVGRHENGWVAGQPQDIRCALGLGDGEPTLTPVAPFVGGNTFAISAGDFNADGMVDFVFALDDAEGDPDDGVGPALAIALGTGTCEMTLVWTRLIDYVPSRIWVGELDGSPGLDFHTGEQLFIGDGTGTFWIPIVDERPILALGAVAGDEAFDDRLRISDTGLQLEIDDDRPIEVWPSFYQRRPAFSDVDKDGSLDVAVVVF